MKRKIFGIMLVTTALLAVGCEKKEEDKTPKIICKSSEEMEGMKSDAVTTITLMDDKQFVKEYVSEITIVVDDENMYNIYKSAMQEEENEKDEDVETKNEFDDANKTIKTTMKATVSDERLKNATEEEKEEMKTATLVTRIEKEAGTNCEFKNFSKEEIGL